jgi:uncharacterized protein (TIGR02569 family)
VRPSARVLDLFAVPDDVRSLPGGQGRSVRAGDLVLSPDRDAAIQDWLSPLLARFAVQLDQDPARRRQDLRVAVPVPARDGSWVVDGWAASRYEPGTVTCRDLGIIRAAGHLLHARLATIVTERPAPLAARADRWAVAERIAFGEAPLPDLDPAPADLAARVREAIARETSSGETVTGAAQLVHADLAGNVLLDAAGAPVVIDVAPAWRPPQWADAVCVLDSVLRQDAPRTALEPWAGRPDRAAMLRAILFRLLSDRPPDLDGYASVLSSVTPPQPAPGSGRTPPGSGRERRGRGRAGGRPW